MNADHPTQLRVGPLSATFYRGVLRYVTVHGHEVLRRLYVTVRDATWGTLQPVIRPPEITADADGFRIAYFADYRQGEIELNCEVWIVGRTAADGPVQLEYRLQAAALHDFETNRVGLCVLHPIEGVRGTRCAVTHADGRVSESKFPDDISPDAPFTDIAALRHSVSGVDVRLQFVGETFETEDQRNWSDTSYKTYCRPQARPRPYAVRAGERVEQRVMIEIDPRAAEPAPSPGPLGVGRAIGPMPRVGTVMNDLPPAAAVEALRRLSLAFVRHDARPAEPRWAERLAAVASLGWPIDLALHVDDAAALPPADALPAAVRRVIVYQNHRPTPDPSLAQAARDWYGRLPIGGGTSGNFTGLNRHRPPAGAFDALAYAVSPQVHAVDDWSLMENLAAQADQVRTARTFAGGASLAVGPVTLHRPIASPLLDRAAAPVDARHVTPFAAAWTIGSLKHLFESGAATVCYYEAAGPNGLVADDGTPHPVFEVFAALADLADGEVLQVADAQPLQYKAFAIRRGRRTKLFLANVGQEPVAIAIEGGPSVTLPPHGTRVVDVDDG